MYVSNLVSESFTLEPAIESAVKTFRRSKPWRGTVAERREKFLAFHKTLVESGQLTARLTFSGSNPDNVDSVYSGLDLKTNVIKMHGRLSVVTYLWLVASALGETRPMAFAINVFARFFPRSFAASNCEGRFVRRAECE